MLSWIRLFSWHFRKYCDDYFYIDDQEENDNQYSDYYDASNLDFIY